MIVVDYPDIDIGYNYSLDSCFNMKYTFAMGHMSLTWGSPRNGHMTLFAQSL